MAEQLRCPKYDPNLLATFVRDMPKGCVEQTIARQGKAVGLGLRVAHWAVDQYQAVSPETKQQVKDVAKEVAVEAVRVGFPVASMFLNFFKE